MAAIEAGQLREELQAARAEAERARVAAESGKVVADRRVAAKEKEVCKLKEEALVRPTGAPAHIRSAPPLGQARPRPAAQGRDVVLKVPRW